jgi:hypothetical protein
MANQFESIISAKAVGTADVQAQADAMRKLAESIEGLGTKANKVNDTLTFDKFAEKVKAGIHNPLTLAGDLAEGFLKKLGPVGTGIAATGVAVGVFGKFAMDAARSLGSLGDEIEDTSARMGMSTRETQNWRLAMKMVGGDMASVEGAMRKLSTEIEEGGDNLRKLGVNFLDANTGGVRPMSAVLLEVAQRLGAIPSVTERNATAVKILGRSALELLPDLVAIPTALERAAKAGLIFTDQEIKGFGRLQEEMALVDARWDFMVSKMKQGVTVPLMWVLGGDIDKAPKGTFGSGNFQLNFESSLPGTSAEFRAKVEASQRAAAAAAERQGVFNAPFVAANDAAVAYARGGMTDENKLATAQKHLADHLKELQTGVLPEVNRLTFEKIAADRVEVAGLEAKIKATKDLEAAIKSLADSQAAFNAFDTLGGKRQTRTEQLKTLLDPFGIYGQGYGLGESLKTAQALWDSMAEFDSFESGGARKLESGADRSRRITDPFGMFGQGAGLQGTLEKFQAGQEAKLRSLQLESSFAERIVELRAGPGGELDTARQVAQIRQQAIEREYAMTGDLNAYREESRRNEMEFALQMAQLQRQRNESIRGELGGVFDALTGGSGGMRQFVTGQARNLGRAAFSNTATSLITGSKISAQSTFGGTWLGDVFSAKGGDGVKASTDANTMATVANTRALMAFSAKVAMSASGGGGGSIGAFGDLLGGGSDGPPSDYLGGGDWGDGTMMPTKTGASKFGTYLKYGGAAAGVGLGVYGAATSPSTKGKLASAGGALMAASVLTGPAAPFVAAAGAALELASVFMKDPKQARAEELERDRASRAYNAPVGSDYQVDTYGRGYDYDYQGRMRPINVTIQTFDPQNFQDYLVRNPAAVAAGVSSAIMNDEQITATLSQVMA